MHITRDRLTFPFRITVSCSHLFILFLRISTFVTSLLSVGIMFYTFKAKHLNKTKFCSTDITFLKRLFKNLS